MKTNEFEQKFLDHLEGRLSEAEDRELKAALDKDTQLKAAFEAYQRVVTIECQIAGEQHQAGPQFAVKVLDRIEEEEVGFLRRLSMTWSTKNRQLVSSVGVLATVLLVVLLTKDISHEEYRASQRQAGEKPKVTQKPIETARTEPEPAEKKPAAPQEAAARQAAESVLGTKNEISEAENSDAVSAQDKRSEDGVKRLDEARKALNAEPAVGIEIKRHRDEWMLLRSEKRKADTLAAIEDRLSMKQRENKSAAKLQTPAAKENEGKLKNLGSGGSNERGYAKDELSGPGSADAEESVAELQLSGPEQSHSLGAAGAVAPPEPAKREMAFSRSPSGIVAKPAQDMIMLPQVPPPPHPEPVPGYPLPRRITPPLDDADNYKGYEEQPRVRTVDEAMSTFSVDVDTASYTNARRFLMAGNIPPQDSIRIEEFINYFDYGYPDQTDKPFSLTYEIAPSPLEKDRLLLLLGIKARAARAENKPWNLVFLVDSSGSMSPPERLELIKKGLHVLVGKMRPEDKVSIVTYAGTAGLVLDATTVKDTQRILSAIDALGSGGSTNGAGGIQVAYEVAQKNFINGGVNRVVLATDGDFNVGVTSNEQLVKMIEEKRRSGITLTTLGVGTDNFKDSRLEQLADKGNGNYFYLDSFQEARHVLGEKIAGTMEVVAKDVKLQVEFNPQHVAQYRLIGYDNRKLNKEDFDNDAIDAGEIGVGHTVTALYEVVLTNTDLSRRLNTEYRYRQAPAVETPTPAANFTPELAFLKIRYKDPEAAQSQLLEFPLEASRVKQNVDSASRDFKFASAVAYFGTILRGSKFIGSYSLSDVIYVAEQAVGEDPSGQRREFVNMVKNAEARMGSRISNYGGHLGYSGGTRPERF